MENLPFQNREVTCRRPGLRVSGIWAGRGPMDTPQVIREAEMVA